MKQFLLLLAGCLGCIASSGQSLVATNPTTGFSLNDSYICVDSTQETELVSLAAGFLKKDIEAVTGGKVQLSNSLPKKAGTVILVGRSSSPLLATLIRNKKIDLGSLQNKWEAFHIQTLSKALPGIENLVVITGSDRRGIAYGVFEFSRQIGVSPWYWWADVPVKKNPAIRILSNKKMLDAPQVKYRGIFINDEAPALSGWVHQFYGGFKHGFYEKVFELILRLKGNYIWPAMWGNAFYDDDSLNIRAANKYGIVIGTSHHEPLMRAHDEWRRYGQGKWNYDSNEARLQDFWRTGMKRAQNEKIVSVGMRGDGDMPMSRETATGLLERIVRDQREIIADITGKPASETPQLWALYKEVQEYYDKGMRVPDDVTLLLCDDNWGNLRKLPRPNTPARKGGYGIYYHFDYVGGPRNYKWLNTNPLPRVWEQMHLAWTHGVKQIWIVNVGDIKPMEFPISFFLEYAWNPDRIGPEDIRRFTESWATEQFGKMHAREIADILSLYTKYNGRRKPELLDANTYNLESGEWERVNKAYATLYERAEKLATQIPAEYQDAYYQLVLHPVKACSNLYDMYYHVALNKWAFVKQYSLANEYAEKVKERYLRDSMITLEYHALNKGKWNHLMSQTHIGYTYWQQPPRQKMPVVQYLKDDEVKEMEAYAVPAPRAASIPPNTTGPVFYQDEWKGVSMHADHFTRKLNANGIEWKVIPDLGRTGSAVTSFPVTHNEVKPGNATARLEYDFYTYGDGPVTLDAYFSPSLNFYNSGEGLQYAISIDEEAPQIISLNKEDKTSDRGIWNQWAGENIIIKSSQHKIDKPGKHTVKFWVVTNGVVLQKLCVKFGTERKEYLGPEETINK